MLSAILYLGNVTYKKRASGRDEGLDVGPPEVLDTLSQLLKVPRGRAGAREKARTDWGPSPEPSALMGRAGRVPGSTLPARTQVKREILVEVLTKRKTVTANDKLILPYSLSEVGAAGPGWAGQGGVGRRAFLSH